MRKQKITEELLKEYSNICEAGFQGTIDDYIFYKENYGKDISSSKKDFYKFIQDKEDENLPF